MEYPDDNMISVFDKVAAKQIYAYSNENNELQDLHLGASGNIKFDTDTFELNGDTVLNSNIVINETAYFGDMNIFRTFPAGHTISYGLRISDDERLEIYKHDSRENKSVVVNRFGLGAVTTDNATYSETSTGKLNALYNKTRNVQRPVH